MSTVYFADKDALKGSLVETLKSSLPTVFLGVPRVWEKIQEKMQQVGKANKGIKRQIGQWAKKTGLKHNKMLLSGMLVHNFFWLLGWLFSEAFFFK